MAGRSGRDNAEGLFWMWSEPQGLHLDTSYETESFSGDGAN